MTNRQKKNLLRIGLSAALFITGLLLPAGPLKIAALMITYLLVGWDVLREAAENIWHGEIFDENFLMSVATIGAIAIGEYPEAALVM